MRPESAAMVASVLQFIREYGHVTNREAALDSPFNDLALRLFAFQYQWNPVYRRYCQVRRRTPYTVRHWRDIPPVPIQAFKETTLSCEPPEQAAAVFMTSGTTRPDQRGRNVHPVLTVWDASMMAGFRLFVLPPGPPPAILTLSPGADQLPNSSLARYLSKAVCEAGGPASACLWAEGQLDVHRLVAALQRCTAERQPVLLMGATFAYVHAFALLAESGVAGPWPLPPGSLVFDTGGMKGQGRELTRTEFLQQVQAFFGVPPERTVNMYGMTELSSQMYDQTLLTHGALTDKAGPAWVRTLVLHPETLTPQPPGTPGILAHVDLANWNSALAILTEDMGVDTGRGFVLLGRAQGSEARGCSIAIDQLLRAQAEQP
ncbi:MAG: CoF synthetase [Alicyclobacillus sp.]|nr:CoF synthetase [Alicyclobacillus sp.]